MVYHRILTIVPCATVKSCYLSIVYMDNITYNSLHLLTPNSLDNPSPTLSLLAITSVLFMSVSLFLSHNSSNNFLG